MEDKQEKSLVAEVKKEKDLAISLSDLTIRIKDGVVKKYANEHSFKTAVVCVLILKGWT